MKYGNYFRYFHKNSSLCYQGSMVKMILISNNILISFKKTRPKLLNYFQFRSYRNTQNGALYFGELDQEPN